MKNKITTTLVLVAASLQVACGKSKKEKAIDAFVQQCNTQACVDAYADAARKAGLVGPAAAAALPQVATPGAPILPGQVTDATILPASVSDTQVAAQQAKIKSQLQAIVAAQPSASPAATPATTGGTYQAASASGPVSVGVTRLPASDVAGAGPATPVQLTSATTDYQPASVDNGSAFAGEAVDVGAGAGR